MSDDKLVERIVEAVVRETWGFPGPSAPVVRGVRKGVLAALQSERARMEGERLTPDEAWQDLVEKDDRTSPEDYPEMCLITFDELRDYMNNAALTSSKTGD